MEFDPDNNSIVVGSTAAGIDRGKEFRLSMNELSARDKSFVNSWAEAAAVARNPSAEMDALVAHKRSENGDVTFDIGIHHIKSMEFADASKMFHQSITIYRDTYAFRKQEAALPLVASLTNRAICLLRKGNESTATRLLKEAVEVGLDVPGLRANIEMAKPLMPEKYRNRFATMISMTKPSDGYADGLVFLSRRDAARHEHYTDACLTCDGRQQLTCGRCRGQGKVKQLRWINKTDVVAGRVFTRRVKVGVYVPCPKCDTRGRVACFRCDGRGKDPRFAKIAAELRSKAILTDGRVQDQNNAASGLY